MANKNENNQSEERILTKYDRKMQKRREEEIRARKRKLAVRGMAIGVIAIAVILAAFVIISNVGKSMSYIKVDEKSISKSEFEFYYNQTVSSAANNYMYTLQGLDTSKALDEQSYSDDLTWKDYLEQQATQSLVQVKALVKDAKANDFEGDVDGEYDKLCEQFAEYAKSQDMSEKDYYKQMFGGTKADLEEYMREMLLAQLWQEEVSKTKEPTVDEIEAYYEENKTDYDCVSYYVKEVSVAAVTAEDGTEDDAATLEAARKKAQDALTTLEVSGEYKEYQTSSGMSSVLVDWLFDEARTPDETAVVDAVNGTDCYAVKFVERIKDETPTADILAVITDAEDADADAILAEYEKGDKTEDSFKELVKKYTTDTSVEDGLYEGVSRKNTSMEQLSDWLDKSLQEGDTTAFKTDDGVNYVVYFKGDNEPYYQLTIKDELVSERLEDYLNDLTAPIKVADPNGVLKYLQVAGE